MTVTELHPLPTDAFDRDHFELVAFDLYSHIHKGLRVELFAVTAAAGRVDPCNPAARQALAEQVHRTADILEMHARHEDGAVLPVLSAQLPELAEKIASDHGTLEPRFEELVQAAGALVSCAPGDEHRVAHYLYLGLASFTAAYLAHQQVEERVVGPALEVAVGVPGLVQIHEAILSTISPEEMAASLRFMLPAMNVDERAELLGGVKAGAPAEVFAGIMGLARSVLSGPELAALAARLGE